MGEIVAKEGRLLIEGVVVKAYCDQSNILVYSLLGLLSLALLISF